MTVTGMKRRIAMALVNSLFSGLRCFGIKRGLLRWAGHTIGAGTRIVGPLRCTGTLIVGKNSWIGRDLTVHGNGTVLIGDDCELGPDVTFLTGGHAMGSRTHRAGPGCSCTIRVEAGCWLSARTTLAGDITVGPGSVLAACGCAVRDIPPNTLAGGVPARPIRYLHEP